jgi:hypothetical protein
MKKLTDEKRIVVSLQDPARLMENAAVQARIRALIEFGIDDCGHSDRVEGWQRSSCSIRLRFEGLELSGGMMGWSYDVIFVAWCECYDDEDE